MLRRFEYGSFHLNKSISEGALARQKCGRADGNERWAAYFCLAEGPDIARSSGIFFGTFLDQAKKVRICTSQAMKSTLYKRLHTLSWRISFWNSFNKL